MFALEDTMLGGQLGAAPELTVLYASMVNPHKQLGKQTGSGLPPF